MISHPKIASTCRQRAGLLTASPNARKLCCLNGLIAKAKFLLLPLSRALWKNPTQTLSYVELNKYSRDSHTQPVPTLARALIAASNYQEKVFTVHMSFEENKAWAHVQNSVSGSQGVDQWSWNRVRSVNMTMSKSRLCGVNILFALACRCTLLGWKKAQGDRIPVGLRNFYRKALLTTSTAATLKMHWLLTTIPPATSVPTTTELTPTAWDGFTPWMPQWMFQNRVRLCTYRRFSTWPVLNSSPFQLIYNTILQARSAQL